MASSRRANVKRQAPAAALPADSVRCMGESVGTFHLADDVCETLAENVGLRLRLLLQEAAKFTRASKRRQMSTGDLDLSMKTMNVEPLYGFESKEFTPFRYASGGGREIYFAPEQELCLSELISTPLPRVPLQVSIRAHWLCIDGMQPAIPENPPPVPMEQQKLEAVGVDVTGPVAPPGCRDPCRAGDKSHEGRGGHNQVTCRVLALLELLGLCCTTVGAVGGVAWLISAQHSFKHFLPLIYHNLLSLVRITVVGESEIMSTFISV